MKGNYLIHKTFAIFLGLFTITNLLGAVVYVDADAAGLNDGSSWQNAFNDLNDAIIAASASDELWVAEGLYKPTSGTNRNNVFLIDVGLSIFGGFNGTETQRNERDWDKHLVRFSGDIGSPADSNNSKTIMKIDASSQVIIDGVRFRKAYSELTDPGNEAALVVLTDARIRHCYFTNNQSGYSAAIYQAANSNVLLEDCLFALNTTLIGNTFQRESNTTATVVNCTFVKNSHNLNSAGMEVAIPISSSLVMRNTIIRENDENDFPPTGDVSNCVFQSGTVNPLLNISNISPNFNNPELNDYRISINSLNALDLGDNSLVQSLRDLRGAERLVNGTVDIGCFEFPGSEVIFVNALASGENTGNSWGDAYTDLQPALLDALEGDSIWVAQGSYYPTNQNDRAVSFVLRNDIPVYGGFIGTETNLTERDWRNNLTILSGNIGQLPLGSNLSNSIHVVSGNGFYSEFTLDGFTIREGNANDVIDTYGGDGAGLFIQSGTMNLSNCNFLFNYGDGSAAYYCIGTSRIQSCVFQQNYSSTNGRIIGISGALDMDNCLLQSNEGGAEGILDVGCCEELSVKNSTFFQNSLSIDGVVVSSTSGGDFVNCIIWDNDFDKSVLMAIESSALLKVSHCILEGLALPATQDEGNNFFEDPLFLNPAIGDLRLSELSVGFNSGDNTFVVSSSDLAGADRIIQGIVDMGCFESPTAAGYCYGDLNGDGEVNAADILAVLGSFGCTQNCTIDFNGDGQTNTAELQVVLIVYGTICDAN